MNAQNSDYLDYLNDVIDDREDDLDGNKISTFRKDQLAAARRDLADYKKTVEQRQFDIEWRDDERNYTSPSQQIARMMRAGLSRAQAIALLEGSSAGTASGIPQQEVNDSPYPSEETALAAQSFNNVAAGVSNVVNAVSSCVQTGYSIPLLKGQAAIQDYLIFDNNQKMEGYKSAQQTLGYMYNAQRHGVNFSPSDYNSFDEMLKGAQTVDWSPYPAAKDFFDSPVGFDSFEFNPYARTLGESQYSARWQTAGVKNNPELLKHLQKAAISSAMSGQLAYDRSYQELTNLVKQGVNLDVSTENISADTENKFAENDLIKAQTKMSEQQALSEKYRTALLKFDEEYTSRGFDDNCKLQNAQLKYMCAFMEGQSADPDLLKEYGKSLAQQAKDDMALRKVLSMYRYRAMQNIDTSEGSTFDDLMKISLFLESTGVFNMLDGITGTYNSFVQPFKPGIR